MYQRSLISITKHILKYPFTHLPKPISPFLSKVPTFSKPTSSHLFPRAYSSSNNNNNNSSSAGEFDKNKLIDDINIKFAEAREEIEAAIDSKETVYFNEEAECAKDAVSEVLGLFDALLSKLDGSEKDSVMRSMGLKMEQLKAELKQLEED